MADNLLSSGAVSLGFGSTLEPPHSSDIGVASPSNLPWNQELRAFNGADEFYTEMNFSLDQSPQKSQAVSEGKGFGAEDRNLWQLKNRTHYLRPFL